MTKSCQVIISVFCLLFATVNTSSKSDKPGPKPKDNCETTYTDINGTIRAHNKTTTAPDHPCNFYVNYNNSNQALDPDHTIFLVFDDVLLDDDDKVTIWVNGKQLKFFDGKTLSKVSGTFAVLTGQSNITITVEPTPSKSFPFTKTFQVFFYSNSECSHTFDKAKSGIFQSPLYDHVDAIFPIQCSFKFAVPDKDNHYMNLWFEPFIFNKGEISVAGALANDGKFDRAPPMEFLVKDILELNVTIFNQTSVAEIFIVKYDSVTNEAKDTTCSSMVTVSDTSTGMKLTSPNKDALRHILSTQDKNLDCLWLIDAENEGHTITLTISDKTNMPQKLDSLIVLDGPNRSSNVLLNYNFENHVNERILYSTGPYLWILANSPFVSEDFYVEFQVSITKSGGFLNRTGTLTISNQDDDVTYLLKVDSKQQVKLDLDLVFTKMESESSVNFYGDYLKKSDPFMTLVPGHIPNVIVSPTAEMAVVASKFSKSSFKGSLSGIDGGCYKYGEGSGNTFSVKGHCDSTCAWIVQPIKGSKDLLAFHFQTMSLNQNDTVLIRKLDAAQTLVANISFPRSNFPDLWLPAETGTFVQVTRSSCPSENTVIQSSYQISSGCGSDFTPEINDLVDVSSPGYPSHYPLNASCIWTVAKPSGSVFLYVTFKDLQLAQANHVLQIFSGTGAKSTLVFTSNSTSKELPDDVPIFDSLTIKFTTNTQMPQESLSGFKMEVAVIGRGGVMTAGAGKVETPSFPQAVNDHLFYVWFVTVNSTRVQKQILQYKFDNRTDFAAIEELLKIYDGPSLHSPLASNMTNDTVLSRTNTVIFVYQNTKPTSQPGFSLSYLSHQCNMSTLCENGICMHDDWFCNRINECGDYTDERNCEGGWSPGPPTPTPPPTENISGASTVVLTGSIVGALIVGLLLGIAVPLGYQYWRSKRLFTYSTVES